MTATRRLRWMKREANRKQRKRARRVLQRGHQPAAEQPRHSAKWDVW